MKTCRCRNLLFIQLPQVLLMINQNQPHLHGDVQNSVAVYRRLTPEIRASSGFFFLLIFLIPSFQNVLLLSACLYYGLECWKVSGKEREADLWSAWRAMKYLESLELLTHFEDRMFFCLLEQYLIFSHLPTSCFCTVFLRIPKENIYSS